MLSYITMIILGTILGILIMFIGVMFLLISFRIKKCINKISFALAGLLFMVLGYIPCRGRINSHTLS
jgi:uncharacterized membrane protein HdeD (DUF308 family)